MLRYRELNFRRQVAPLRETIKQFTDRANYLIAVGLYPVGNRLISRCQPFHFLKKVIGHHGGRQFGHGFHLPDDDGIRWGEQRGRVWLLLRYLDKIGRGWLAPDEVRRVLTDETSPFYLCGKRQLRKLLAQGDGLFWQRDEEHIWLMGLVWVAAACAIIIAI
jgi:hypothetical protein